MLWFKLRVNLAPRRAVAAHGDRRAEVVQHHHRVGCRTGEVDELVHLVVVVPALVGQAAAPEQPDTGSKRFVLRQPSGRGAGGVLGAGAMVATGQAVADAAEAPLSGGLVRVEHLFQRRAKPQVGVGDNAGDLRTGPSLRLTREL